MVRGTRIGGIATAVLLAGWWIGAAHGGGAARVPEALWAHDRLYDTVLTPTSFVAPPAHSTDALYNFGMSGLSGQRSVAESAPGDRDYNGGRWSVRAVVYTEKGRTVFDPGGDGTVDFELTNAEDVLAAALAGDVEILETSIYFECPMLPRRVR